MTKTRVLLGAVGTAVMAYGGWLLLTQATWSPRYLLSLGAWLAIGPPAHDFLLAPTLAFAGVVLTRLIPRPWRTAIIAGLVATGVVLLVAVPVLTRPMAGPANPGLDDRNYLPGLLLFIAAMWALLLAATAVYAWRGRPAGRAAPSPRRSSGPTR
ncbi:hypothetical protein [Micromonospora sp. NPDC049679]|uniref:hypothetical protein n=1 Tax=Micromonospora sp. NPDC049679 TaxID=3155920 RepID=UPI0033C2BFE1